MRRFVNSTVSLILLAVLTVLLPLSAHAATTIHVPADQPTIQAGINAANNGDTVLVSPGTYYENINFNGKAITVKSASGPAATIINGQQLNPVVTFSTNEGRTSVLSGFTLTNGYGTFNAGYEGGGILINGASPTIRQNVITLNAACSSGMGIGTNSGSPLIQNNIIQGNIQSGCSGGSGGGGIYLSGTATGQSAQIVGNLIVGNSDYSFSGGIAAWGATQLSISYNVISDNLGGGVFLDNNTSAVTLIQNLITSNTYGPGISWYSEPAVVVSNTIAGNAAPYNSNGSEISASGMDNLLSVENNLLISTGSWSAVSCGSYNTSAPPVFSNNDAFSADASAYDVTCPTLTGSNGNISVDPLFVALLSDNYRIQSGSPAIDAGSNSATGLPSRDFAGDARIINGVVDIGADEYTSAPALPLSTNSLEFGTQQVGSSSASQIVTLTNSGTKAISVPLIATGSSFSQSNNCGTSLASGSNCQIAVSFSPAVGGIVNSVLGIFTSATQNPQFVSLNGTGLAPQVNFCCGFYFSGQVIGTTNTQTNTLTNIGQAPLAITSIIYSGTSDFVESNTCPIAPNTLSINASCTVTVSYTPTIVGSESGTITINDNASPSTQTTYLNGTSVSAGNPVFSPSSLTFPTVLIGQTSAPQTSTLTNAGSGPLGITSIYSYGDFPQTNNCPASLAVNASCTFTVTFTPSVGGSDSGAVYVYTDSQFYYATLTSSGTGQAPVPTISSLSVSSLPAGSADTQVTMTGTGFVNYVTQVYWNGSLLNYCCVSYSGTTQLTFTIPAANLASAGTSQISVFTPAPGGGISNSVPLTVYQPINYAFQSTTYNYRNIAGTSLNFNSYYQGVSLTSPFPIQFGGGSFTNLTIGASGTISFNGFYYPYNDVIPTAQTPMVIAPFWMPLYPIGTGTNNNVFWQVLGTAPNRQLVIEWRNVGICCETTNTVRFEVVFFEGNSNVLFNYADTVFGGSYSNYDNGALATVGVQVAPNLGNQFSYDQASLSSQSAILWYPNSPAATLSTGTVSFGYHQIGTSTLPQALTLTNGGLVPLAISNISTNNADFTQTNNCGTSVAPLHSCSIHVVFKPTQPTTETATLSIVDNATNSPQTVSLTGTGTVTGIVVFPVLVNFGSVTVASTSTAPVTLANATNQPLTIQGITTTPSVYTATNNCGSAITPGQSCTITVSFTPTQKGSVQGTLSMALNGKASTVKANLTGSGQ